MISARRLHRSTWPDPFTSPQTRSRVSEEVKHSGNHVALYPTHTDSQSQAFKPSHAVDVVDELETHEILV